MKFLRTTPLWLVLGGALAAAGCKDDITGPSPTISAPTEPHLVCNAQKEFPVDLTGSGFSPLSLQTATGPARLALPQVEWTQESDLAGTPVTGTPVAVQDDPSDPASSQLHWTSQASMTADINPDLMLTPGVYGVTVTNRNGSAGSLAAALAVVPPPVLSSVTPMAICIAQGDVVLQLDGEGFLRVETAPGTYAQPSVTITSTTGTATYTATGVVDTARCAELPAPATDADRCTRLTVTIPRDQVPVGTYAVRVTNPPPADCYSTEPVTVEVVPPPDLVSVTPAILCTGGGTLNLSGTAFRQGASVQVGSATADSVTVNTAGTSAQAVFGAAGLVAGTTAQDVTIRNPEGCFDTLTMAVTVVDGPILFWVDPAVAFNGITINLTLYASGLNGNPTSVRIVDTTGMATALSYVRDAKGRVQATLPSGTTPGVYDVEVVDSSGCPAVLPDALTVVSATDASLTAITPPFAQSTVDTAVTLDGSNVSGGALTGAERIYLNPDNAGPNTVASALRAVSLVNPSRLNAVVPSGLAAQVYDVIMVTADGHVALLDQGLTVTTDPPPVLDFVSPAQVVNGGVRTLSARGTGIRNPTVTWACRNYAAAATGATTTATGTVTASTTTDATITIDATALQPGDVCVLRLTNADGTYTDYSAVSVTGPSSNIQPFLAGTTMQTGRRALGLAVGRTTRAARFLHAIGGDTGAASGALTSIESVSIDAYGLMGSAWSAQPNSLPAPRTFAQAQRLGEYIYLVGGHDGAGATASVLRAEVLNPLDSPEVSDVTAVRKGMATEPGLGAGQWYYRVAAVFPSTDARNPSGESLPSDPLPVQLPAGLPDTVYLTVEWPAIAGASAYRIYRSPSANAPLAQIQLLAEVTATGPSTQSFQDRGLATMGGSPLPIGALGTWATMPSLSVARAAAGVGLGVDPTDANRHYLYAFGGRDGADAPLASYEFLRIDLNPDGTQNVASGWTAGDQNLSAARSEMGVYVLDNDRASRIPAGQTWLYVGAGRASPTTTSSRVDAAQVTAGGQLATFRTVTSSGLGYAGYGFAGANNFLYVFGGQGGSASGNILSAELCAVGLPGCNTATIPPDLVNWNNAGVNLSAARYLPGSALEGTFVYVVGGADGAGAALSSTDRTAL